MKPARIILDFFNHGQELSRKVKKNIILSLLIKGISILTSFALVPLTLGYIGPEYYGIWLTLSSIIAWFGYLDLGMGNGLRNKLAGALATKDLHKARIYVSTAYASLALIFGGIFVLFFILVSFFDWTVILNTDTISPERLLITVQIVGFFFFMQFVIKLIGTILIADQRPAMNDAFIPAANIFSLFIIYLLTQKTDGNLLILSLVLSGSPIIIYLAASFYYFQKGYRFLIPSLKYVRLTYFKDLAFLGAKFMIIQMAVLIIFSTDNIIITQILGTVEVTPYNIAHRYFGVVNVVFAIMLKPLWSAYTNAFVRNDLDWIKRVTGKMVKVWMLLPFCIIGMIMFSQVFYRFWIGDAVHIPLLLNIFMGLFVLIGSWNNIFVYFINATGKITFQLYTSIIIAILNIPLSIFFATGLGMGSAGVILATCVCLFPGTLLAPYQYKLIINGKAKGIWTK